MPSLNTPASAIPEPFVPFASLQNALHYWWIIVITMLAGGVLAWFAFLVNPAQYEAAAEFSVGIDFVRTGPLTQYEEDTAINTIGDILDSSEVLQKVIDQAGKEKISLSLEDLKKHSVLERRFNVWDLRVRNADPQTAERIAAIWVEQGEAAIREGYKHALQASALERYSRSLESCLAKVAASEPSYGLCDRAHFSDIQNDMAAAGASLYLEKAASKGMFDGLTLGPVSAPQVTQRPVSSGRSQYLLFGSLLGMLAGFGIVELGLPARWQKRR